MNTGGPKLSDAETLSDPNLIAILLRQQESKELDYKAATEWKEDDKKGCCGLVKDILAMANTQGGFIIVGVSEGPSGFSFDGLTDVQAKSFDTTRVNRFLQSYTDPPINARLRKLNYETKVFALIEVPAFPDTPHICQKEFPGVLAAFALYVRTDNNESAPIRSAVDFKNVVEKAVRNRRDALLSSFRSILTSGMAPAEPSSAERFLEQRQEAVARFTQLNTLNEHEPLLGYMESAFLPERFDAARFQLSELRAAIDRAHVTYTGWPFLYINPQQSDCPYTIQDGWEMFILDNDTGFGLTLDFWRLQQSGLFYHRAALRPTSSKDKTPIADLRMLAIYVGEAIDCLIRLYDGLFEDPEYITLTLRVVNTQDRILVNSHGARPLYDHYTCHIPEIAVERHLPLADWRAAVVDHAVAIVNEIYLRFNWPKPTLSLAREVIQRTFARQL